MDKELPAIQETQEMWAWSLGWDDLMKEEMASHSSIFARIFEKSHGQRSMVGYSPWTCKELDTIEYKHHDDDDDDDDMLYSVWTWLCGSLLVNISMRIRNIMLLLNIIFINIIGMQYILGLEKLLNEWK